MERDPTLATIDDITEEEANITMPEVLPSSSGRTTSSSEFSAFAARLQRHRRGAYRKRLSRSREEISASSRSRESAQTTATDDDENEASDADSLASNDVFGSKDDQISFFKQTLVDMNKKLEAYQEINADLSRKLENCKVENKGLKKQIQDILWDKYVLYDKYKKLKERFGIVDSPSGDDDSPGSNNSGPSGAGRVATPVRRPKKRGDSPAGRRDGAGPSKVRPRVMRCGLDREVMESASNSTEESGDSGFSMPDTSDPMLLEASISSRKSRNRSISQDEDQYSNGKEDGPINEDHHHSSECSTPCSTSMTNVPDSNWKDDGENDECSNLSTPCSSNRKDDGENDECSNLSTPCSSNRKDDGENDECSNLSTPCSSNRKDDGENDECSNLSTPCSSNRKDDGENDECSNLSTPCSTSGSPDHVNEMNIFDDEVSKDGTVDPDIDDALHDYEDGDVFSRGSRRTSSSENEEQEKRKSPEESPIEDKSDESCRSSIPRKRKSSTSLSSSGNSTVSKRRKSSSSSPGDTSGTDSSPNSSYDSSSDRSSLPPRRSRSPSPPLPFRDAPGVIPGAPIPRGTRKLPRIWHRDGNDVRRRCSKGKQRGAFRMDGAFTWMAGDSWTALVPFLYRSIYLLFLLAYNLIL